MLLTVAGTERAQWCCLCPWGGWRRQRETSEWAMSSAGELGEGRWPSGQRQKYRQGRKVKKMTGNNNHQAYNHFILKSKFLSSQTRVCVCVCVWGLRCHSRARLKVKRQYESPCKGIEMWYQIQRSGAFTLLSIVSLRRVRSSMAASQFCIRISEASLPHREFRAFLSVAGTLGRDTVTVKNPTRTPLQHAKQQISYTVRLGPRLARL